MAKGQRLHEGAWPVIRTVHRAEALCVLGDCPVDTMARSTIERRHDAERERNERYDAILRLPRASKTLDLDAIIDAVLERRRGQVIRDPLSFRLRMKTKDPGRLALAVARHAFADFPVPSHLEAIWLGREQLEPSELERRKDWYVEVAQGRSLYKSGRTKGVLTKPETHRFLNPTAALGFKEAIWYAIARSYTENTGDALRVARSKVARPNVTPFWRDAARFFCLNPIPLGEINDLCDFLEARWRENPHYSLEGRTLRSLRRGMEDWHRELATLKRIGTGRWEGSPLSDWTWTETHDDPHQDVTWMVTQIKTGQELAEEGNRMRHCVYSYKHWCELGQRSIWSLKARTRSETKRVLTMEMTSANEVIQIRGFANRLASAAERNVLRRWAIAKGISLR
jgi:hypothetical protein